MIARTFAGKSKQLASSSWQATSPSEKITRSAVTSSLPVSEARNPRRPNRT